MTLITYRGRAVALAGRERFYLAPHIAQRRDADPLKTFVCYLAAYAHDVMTGQLPGEPRCYLPARAERYARECLLPPRAFRARAERSDRELAERFGVPLEQIAARRADLAASRCVRSRARRPWRSARVANGDLPLSRRAGASSHTTNVSSRARAAAAPSRPRREVARPPRPRRLRRSGGGEWTRERIVDALRAWADELGRPPRSYDWAPATARAAGFPTDGADKWEREHPDWPHQALVRARCGSWRAALEAAGLPAPRPLAIPRRERVETAQRLQGRLSADELADLLGVTPRTVRSYWRAGTCRRCGGPQIVAGASSCADCIPYVALRRPSRTAVVRALRRWARETGTPPRRHDWLAAGGKWEREYPAWPSAGDVDAHFASWPQALEAAGLRPHRRAWTRAAIIDALQRWAAAHGRAPHHGEWQTSGLEHPPASTVHNVFGTWSAALRAAGLEPALHPPWTAAQVLDGLRAFERDHRRPPTSRDLRHTRGTPYPPAAVVIRTLGSLRAALRQLGHDAAWAPVGQQEMLDALRAYALVHGRAPTVTAWRAERRQPSATVIIRRHGSWRAALAAALGADPPAATIRSAGQS
jgi:hypothetical protein